ncbi:hypothetical protein QBC47DRAFT_356333 [Echria macrotheca]|uniref:Uncharacterized protein n=1 Tax=Echria macrotheca TaxID=438768 RepID=A0AAJ0FGN5_9PEZI|nr:hypothetical protein QBC47DRAFT_356333 [Echria macrotheca]
MPVKTSSDSPLDCSLKPTRDTSIHRSHSMQPKLIRAAFYVRVACRRRRVVSLKSFGHADVNGDTGPKGGESSQAQWLRPAVKRPSYESTWWSLVSWCAAVRSCGIGPWDVKEDAAMATHDQPTIYTCRQITSSESHSVYLCVPFSATGHHASTSLAYPRTPKTAWDRTVNVSCLHEARPGALIGPSFGKGRVTFTDPKGNLAKTTARFLRMFLFARNALLGCCDCGVDEERIQKLVPVGSEMTGLGGQASDQLHPIMTTKLDVVDRWLDLFDPKSRKVTSPAHPATKASRPGDPATWS